METVTVTFSGKEYTILGFAHGDRDGVAACRRLQLEQGYRREDLLSGQFSGTPVLTAWRKLRDAGHSDVLVYVK